MMVGSREMTYPLNVFPETCEAIVLDLLRKAPSKP
jgi:hypothetical protein